MLEGWPICSNLGSNDPSARSDQFLVLALIRCDPGAGMQGVPGSLRTLRHIQGTFMGSEAAESTFLARLPWSVGRRVRIRHVLNAIESLPAKHKILDAGCGDCRLAARVSQRHPESNVLACDVDEHLVRSAQIKLNNQPNLRVRKAEVGGALLGESFDLVICVDVLEHIVDERGAIRWLFAHLSPGASLVLHVPASPQRHWIKSVERAMKAELTAGRGPHVREGYRPEALRALAAEAGLTDIRIEFTFHQLFTQIATDVDTWTYLHSAAPVKAMFLPGLLAAGAIETKPSSTSVGNGLLLMARAPGDTPI